MNKERGHMGKTIVFSSEEDRKLFFNDYSSSSIAQDIFHSWMHQGKYNVLDIKFKENIIYELLKKDFVTERDFSDHDFKLEKLHLCLNSKKKNLDESEQNEISISFYETSEDIQYSYINFLEKYVSTLFDENIHYQVVPTFRFHFPNQSGYNWKNRYHTDIMLGHPPFELNLWIPFTNVYGSNSMRITPLIESLELIKQCDNDFEIFASRTQYDESFFKDLESKSYSLEMNYGDFIIFDPRCLHCTQYNDTKDTRISMDVRIILESAISRYSREYKTTGRKKMPFLPGYYFSKEAI